MQRVALADSEWKLMQVLWEKGDCTFREICDAVCEENGWTKHAVISYLKRMAQKGAIAILEEAPVKKYCPLLDQAQTIRQETRSLLHKVYNGSALLMVQNAVEQQALSEEERQELIALLQKGRGGQ